MENFFDLDQGTNVGISEVIGEGSFGTVTKERLDSINNGVVAVRTVNKSKESSEMINYLV